MAHPPMPETAFDSQALDQLVELRAQLLDLGYNRAKVAGCLDFLLGHWTDTQATPVNFRPEYRKMLRAVLANRGVPWPPPKTKSTSTKPGLWALWLKGHAA